LGRQSLPSAPYLVESLQPEVASLQSEDLRKEALKRIQSLDCANPNTTFASCDPTAETPPAAATWRKALESAREDDEAYAKALAKVLNNLVCSGDEEAIHVVRGLGFQSRLSAAGVASIDLIDDLVNKDSKDCPASTSLTDAERAKLLQIKQGIEAKAMRKSVTSGAPYSP
jgi:hypothetical protein